jgi:hypothetical protein
MTKQEFERSVDRLINLKPSDPFTECDTKVFAAAGFVIRHRLNIPDDEAVNISVDDVAAFLRGLDPARKRKLKKIADGIIEDGIEPIH